MLTAKLEQLILLGSSNINGTGNGQDNLIFGNSGVNVLTGAAGADTLVGNDGNDTASYGSSNAAVTVNLLTGVNSGGHAAGDVLGGIENLKGSAHADSLTGDAGINVIEGAGGADTIDGRAGRDTASYASSDAAVTANLLTGVYSGGHATGDVLTSIENLKGSAHDDSLTGSNGTNRLDGGAGGDTLVGAAGGDTLVGGGGNDAFVFDSAIGVDVDEILDFAAGADDVVLDNDVFTKLGAGALAAGNFVSGSGAVAADADDYVLYDTDDGFLYYDADGNGGDAAVHFATLSNLAAIGAGDFLVVD